MVAPTMMSQESERTVKPPVLQMEQADVSDAPLGPMQGTVAVLYGLEGNEAIEQFDRSVKTGDSESFRDLMAAKGRASDRVETDADASVSADLQYHGETVMEDLTLSSEEMFAFAYTGYNGGELDETAFEIVETSDEDVEMEYRIVVLPPALDEAEAQAAQQLPSDADNGMVMVGDATETEVCGTFWGAAAVGVALVTLADDAGASALLTDADEVEMEADDTELGASVEEMVGARA